MCSFSRELSMASPCGETKMTHMSVCQLESNLRYHTVIVALLTNDLAGWVKEQSLRGIVDWFDYWLALESFSKK